MAEHTPTLKQGPSGIRAECSCGWGGMPRYTAEQAYADHADHSRHSNCAYCAAGIADNHEPEPPEGY